MAYKQVPTYRRQLEEEKTLGTGTPAPTGATGAAASPTGAAPPTTFANIKGYLDANPEAAKTTANVIMDPLRQEAEGGARAATDYARDKGAYDAWKPPEDPGQMPAVPDKPGSLAGPDAWRAWRDAMNARAAWEPKKKTWDEFQAKGPPAAPTQPEVARKAWEDIQSAGTQSGLAERFQQGNQAPTYTPGAANLDAYLTGRVAGPELEGMRQKYASILGELRGNPGEGYVGRPEVYELGPDGKPRKRKV